MSVNDRIITCEHCGNTTLVKLIGKYREDNDDIAFEWELVRCSVCHNPSLLEMNSDDFDEDGSSTVNILYPASFVQSWGVPSKVGREYRKALRLRHIDADAFAVAIGRVLDMICQDRNAQGNDLYEKINNLSENELPRRLAEIAHQLRLIRNLGAHADRISINNSDIPLLIEFIDLILNYLYIVPTKLEELKQRMEARKTSVSKILELESDD